MTRLRTLSCAFLDVAKHPVHVSLVDHRAHSRVAANGSPTFHSLKYRRQRIEQRFLDGSLNDET